MAEVIRLFEDPILVDGVPYAVQVAARPDGHLWEGWIEFIAPDGSDARRTPRETTQPDRDAIVYWATGLSPTYLEGAFERTIARPHRVELPMPPPVFAQPAPTMPSPLPLDPPSLDRAVLDPFSVGAKGEDLLRQELGALESWHLRNIVRAYALAPAAADLQRLSQRELIELIVVAVGAA
jgi:hypothetical protein